MKKASLLGWLMLSSVMVNINSYSAPTGNYQLSCEPGSCSIEGEILTCKSCGAGRAIASAMNYKKCRTRRVEIGSEGKLVCTNKKGDENTPEDTYRAYKDVPQPQPANK